MSDLISRQAAIEKILGQPPEAHYPSWYARQIEDLPPAPPEYLAEQAGILVTDTDTISRQAAIDALRYAQHRFTVADEAGGMGTVKWSEDVIYFAAAKRVLDELPSAQPEKEKAKRVLWTGWKGCRNTRYKCPNCKKPVKNDDIYCHRCGQKLMFPHISFTDYVPGEKQETIVRWDDE